MSFTYFISYFHMVPSKLVGVGLAFHRKAMSETEDAEVRGLPPNTPGRSGNSCRVRAASGRWFYPTWVGHDLRCSHLSLMDCEDSQHLRPLTETAPSQVGPAA